MMEKEKERTVEERRRAGQERKLIFRKKTEKEMKRMEKRAVDRKQRTNGDGRRL
jgi:hypothetical protein